MSKPYLWTVGVVVGLLLLISGCRTVSSCGDVLKSASADGSDLIRGYSERLE